MKAHKWFWRNFEKRCIKNGPKLSDHLTCLLRNLYAGQEATLRTGHGTTDWFQIGKGVCKAVYCHPTYLTYMQSTSWETLDWTLSSVQLLVTPWTAAYQASPLMGFSRQENWSGVPLPSPLIYSSFGFIKLAFILLMVFLAHKRWAKVYRFKFSSVC